MSRRRPKKLHLFLNWVRDNRHRFPFNPEPSCFKGGVDLSFREITRKIVIRYSKSGVVISTEWEGRCWDFIGDFEVAERRNNSGYYCNLCEAESQFIYPTREELWVTHCFKPFLDWCHTKLSSAQWLEYSDYGGVTSAILLMNKLEDNQHWEPVKSFIDNMIPYGKTEPEKIKRELRTFIIPVRTSKRVMDTA